MSQEHKYAHILRAISETPWAILPSKLAVIRDMIAFRAAGQTLTPEEIQARIGAGPARRDMQLAGTVAVLPVYGVIVPRADAFTQMSGGTSIARLSATFREALEDEQVTAIVFDVDSPGGKADMVPEFAAEVRAARGKKPIVAVANTLAASAAYWIASQAGEVVVTPSGEVGSIGVLAAHADISAMQKKLGVTTTLITYGENKGEGNPFEPLTEESRAALQERVDETGRMLDADVAKGRRVSVETVRAEFGQGRVFTARGALKRGMVDRIDTLQATVQRVARGPAAPQLLPAAKPADLAAATGGLSFADEAETVRDAAIGLVNRLGSLAELERGRLTAAKRDALSACPEALREAAEHIATVLAQTDPDRHSHEFLREAARFEQLRAN